MSASNNTPRPTIEELRRRARNRLIGAALLVVGAIVVFSFLFDSKPRPTTEEIDFAIPSEGQVKPIGTAEGQRSIQDLNSSTGVVQPFDDGADITTGGVEEGANDASSATTDVQGNASLSPDEEFVGSWEEETVAATGNVAAVKQEKPKARATVTDEAAKLEKQKAEKQKAEEQAKKKAQAQQEKKEKEVKEKEAKAKRAEAERKKKEEARVKAILSGEKQKAKEAKAAKEKAAKEKAKKQAQKQKQAQQAVASTKPKTSDSVEADLQYIVQFGSLKDPVRAEAVRAQVAAKGLSAYTQTADTSKGTYTRLRSGPYNSRAAANAAAEKIKAMGHPVLVKKR